MEELFFYIKLGLRHVLDPQALDHLLFLSALAIPYTPGAWKKVLLLATAFTITHCLSLAMSVYGWIEANATLIEFLIPLTILLTALGNIYRNLSGIDREGWWLQLAATAFFGLIHGLGFSNYFNMLMAEEDEKALPLLGFAGGIEISQLLIISAVLFLTFVLVRWVRIGKRLFIMSASSLIALLTLPMIAEAWPW